VLKKLIFAKIYLTDFDADKSNLVYKLKFQLISMPWTDLFNQFAFPPDMYSLSFCIVAGAQIGLFLLLYIMFRACSRGHFAELHFIGFQKLILPGPLMAFFVVGVPTLIFLAIAHEYMVVQNVFYYTSCSFQAESCDADATVVVRAEHFVAARAQLRPSVSDEDLAYYRSVQAQFAQSF
jgi:uncharacterized membrane protein